MSLHSSNLHLFVNVQRLLFIAVLALGVYAFLVFKNENVEQLSLGVSHQSNATIFPNNNYLEPLKPNHIYTDQLNSRDLFNVGTIVPESQGPVVSSNVGQPLPAQFKIVGVIIGKPSEVIVEDIQAQQTYFINENDDTGVFKIIHVDKNVLKLEYQGQTYDVPLKETS